MCRMSWKSGSLNLLEPSGPHRACCGTPSYHKCDKTLKHCARSNARNVVYLTCNPLFRCSPFLTVSALNVRRPGTVPQCIQRRVEPCVSCSATFQCLKRSLCCFMSVNKVNVGKLEYIHKSATKNTYFTGVLISP